MCHTAFAGSYPWIQISSEDIRMVPNPVIEAELRLSLIKKAQHSIDLVIWDQREDETVGMPILKALRDAADRGVKIRFLLSWSGHMEDTFNRSRQLFDTTSDANSHSVSDRGWLTYVENRMGLSGWHS